MAEKSFFQMAPSNQGEYKADLQKFRPRLCHDNDASAAESGFTNEAALAAPTDVFVADTRNAVPVHQRKKAKQSSTTATTTTSSTPKTKFPEPSVQEIAQLLLPESTKYPCTDEDDHSSIRLDATQGVIPLWEPGSTLTWTVLSNFPSTAHRRYVEAKMVQAIEAWNLGPELKFQYVADMNAASFVVTYSPVAGSTLARAFFPNAHQNQMLVFQSVFRSQDYTRNLHLILEHELGHVIGLRHEFAPEREGGDIGFGPRDDKSVMTYNWPMSVQDQDRDLTRLLYQDPIVWQGRTYPKLTQWGTFRVVRYTPY